MNYESSVANNCLKYTSTKFNASNLKKSAAIMFNFNENVTARTKTHFNFDVPDPTTISYTTANKRWIQSLYENNDENHTELINRNKPKHGLDGLPLDPREWTRYDVWNWVDGTCGSEGISIAPDLVTKFSMNGKALCLMSLDMYLSRIPCGGKMLYRDFRVRLARAMTISKT